MNKGFGPQVLKLREQEKSYREIAALLGCSVPTVSYHCSKLKGNEAIKAARKNRLHRTLTIPDDARSMLAWLLVAGVRRKDISDALTLPLPDVQTFAKQESMQRQCDTMSPYERVRRRRMHLKMLAVAYKGGKCIRCGYHKSIRAMDFHHPDSGGKDFSISQNANRAWNQVKIEIDKCILLCSNCHREEHDRLELYAPAPPLLKG